MAHRISQPHLDMNPPGGYGEYSPMGREQAYSEGFGLQEPSPVVASKSTPRKNKKRKETPNEPAVEFKRQRTDPSWQHFHIGAKQNSQQPRVYCKACAAKVQGNCLCRAKWIGEHILMDMHRSNKRVCCTPRGHWSRQLRNSYSGDAYPK